MSSDYAGSPIRVLLCTQCGQTVFRMNDDCPNHEERHVIISRHELLRVRSGRVGTHAGFFIDCFRQFFNLAPPGRGILGDDLVLIWREDFDQLVKRATTKGAADGQ